MRIDEAEGLTQFRWCWMRGVSEHGAEQADVQLGVEDRERRPIPELVEVPFQVLLELLDRLLVDAGGTVIGVDSLIHRGPMAVAQPRALREFSLLPRPIYNGSCDGPQ